MGICFLLSSCFNCTRRTCSDATPIDQREDTSSLDAMGSERLPSSSLISSSPHPPSNPFNTGLTH
uniref:Uncharacterized protein n=1 Tax=Pristionchus pacificus TaxID=54126 RepID=A0A2A6C5Q9_PRIPA|eukprot:PDM73494.1 hypothetical protein PRIPAC_40850 [Pristionchus pacificus]